MALLIRPERPGDQDAIDAVIRAAFTAAIGGPHESVLEVGLVRQLRAEGDLALSLVAEEGGRILGHVAFFKIGLVPDPGRRVWGLAPLSVAPERQGQGIGAALARSGIDSAHAAGVDLVLVLGDPDYYGRFGFRAEPAAGFDVPWPGPHFMGLALGDLAPMRARANYPKAFAVFGA